MDWSTLWLALTAFGAAIVNGAIGYGFSSIVTPIAVLWFSNRLLNPALVLIELVVNISLLVRERAYLRATWPRARWIVTTMLPGVILGTAGLTYLAVDDVKVALYAVLLPLAVVQLLGLRRPMQNEQRGGAAMGPCIGFLYALTTISGPPLAIFFRNQGLSKDEFRCAVAQVRVAESGLTLSAYLAFTAFFGANLVSVPALSLLPFLAIPVLVGVPLGTLVLRSVSRESFNRVVMAMDGLIVAYGLSQVLPKLHWLSPMAADVFLLAASAGVIALTYYALSRLARATPAPHVIEVETTPPPAFASPAPPGSEPPDG